MIAAAAGRARRPAIRLGGIHRSADPYGGGATSEGRHGRAGCAGRAGFAYVDLDWFSIPPRWSAYDPCIADRAIALAWPLTAPVTACSDNQGDHHAAAHPGR